MTIAEIAMQLQKTKVIPYSLPSVGPVADHAVQAVSPQVTVLFIPGGRLPLLSARPVVTFPTEERHCPSTCAKLYCSATKALRCEQLAQGCYADDHGETRTHDLNDYR